ncbi:MAG: T9SS type A sorting domain-containing protein [Saprospiraceae bacterium]|nr:T9SS type A sorting domain-containing protein [Saprospiraceae bacterium]
MRQEDFDGSIHYSDVISATVAEDDIRLGITPNPAGESVRLHFSHSDFSGPAVVTVFEANGRLSLQQTLGFEDGVATAVIDLAGLTDGVYLVRVITAQDGYSTRMVNH